jgi:phosphate starvation-inducible PhoH-like protein
LSKNKKRENEKTRKRSVVIPAAKVRQVKARGENQQHYLDLIETVPVTFSIGPAGTGKTFLACYVAAKKLVSGEITKIILTRPAVEADESLGFLPGTLEDKLDPYMRPLYDSMNDVIGAHAVKQLLSDRIIEIVPLAYMRGRTLNNAFVILDEAQNTTVGQMKMFLTRMGNKSTFIINGDITQTDIDDGQSGLVDASLKLKEVEGVSWVRFDRHDVVRHWVVQNILERYED